MTTDEEIQDFVEMLTHTLTKALAGPRCGFLIMVFPLSDTDTLKVFSGSNLEPEVRHELLAHAAAALAPSPETTH